MELQELIESGLLKAFGDKVLPKYYRKLNVGDAITYEDTEYVIEEKKDISFLLKPKDDGTSIEVYFIYIK